ncbi:unnamed protein product [Effrenium voratum]|nr:unnamed protein product [Effrenium voratum]
MSRKIGTLSAQDCAMMARRSMCWLLCLMACGVDAWSWNKFDTCATLSNFLEGRTGSFRTMGAVAGIMGNIDVETGGTFDPHQQQAGGTGHGLFQLDGKLLDVYWNWLKAEGRKDEVESQIVFLFWLLFDKPDYIGRGFVQRLLSSFQQTDDPAQLAEAFCQNFERPGKPHLDRRTASARSIAQDLKASGQCPPPPQTGDVAIIV